MSAVAISGSTATYTGSFPSASFTGTTVTFSGFTNTGNNGAFVVTSSSSTSLVVTNASAVNETPTSGASALLTTYASHSDTGTIAYLNDGTYTDTMSAVHAYTGLEIWTHPGQAYTIVNHPMISGLTVLDFQGAQIVLHQPNYGYIDRVTCLGSQYSGAGGLLLESAHPTTGRYTDPSAFEVRGGCQLYGQCFGIAAVAAAGLTIGMTGNNGSGIAILLEACSGVNVIGGDLESQTPLSGQTDLWPGDCIEVVGGAGLNFTGLNLFGGPQGGSGGSSSASQKFFHAWNGATAFRYSDITHLGLSGYVQDTNEILVDSTCSNYYVGRIGLTGNASNVSLGGTNYESDILGIKTLTTNYAGGLTLAGETAAASGQNHSSPVLTFTDTYWNGSASAVGSFTIEAVPNSGTNPAENLYITHYGSPGGSSLVYQSGAFTATGTGVVTASASLTAPAVNVTAGTLTITSATNPQTIFGNTTSGQTYAVGYNQSQASLVIFDSTAGGSSFRLKVADTTGVITIPTSVASTSSSTGALVVSNGVGIGGNLYVGGTINGSGAGLTSIPPSALTSTSLTVTAGTGLSGGGAVSIGGTVTLANAGVTSITGTANQVVASASTGGVTLSLPQNIGTGSNVNFGGGTFNSYLTAITSSAATSSVNNNSPTVYIQGTYWNGSASTTGGFTIQTTEASGTNPVETFNILHAGSSGGSTFNFNNNFQVSGSGYISKYDSIVTAGVGVASIVGVVNLSGQNTNIPATTIVSAPAAGMYRASCYIVCTTAATTSATLPDVEVIYTDKDTSVVQTIQVTAGVSGTPLAVGVVRAGDLIIDAASATNIQFAVGQNQAYASSGATSMVYAVRIRLEYLG